ncbi:hypothetical protein Q5427_11105 [Brochothrix thermosphacta]|uniref:hypothetical protein n=1 Tax=Brochothrix thermosphacta TaxID=2756 RepID=UPI0027139BCA|nr:hypothetical protein [Brochothrix thermosphacta]MDO7864837.1 hypothetical protein [Brochothrix thermosphacta]
MKYVLYAGREEEIPKEYRGLFEKEEVIVWRKSDNEVAYITLVDTDMKEILKVRDELGCGITMSQTFVGELRDSIAIYKDY